jgi:tRNA U34 5-carboxymethylaminomethyl modifying enzyme MnmG/GidA
MLVLRLLLLLQTWVQKRFCYYESANIAQMSCNPAMGGIAKGQIVQIDALGGILELFQTIPQSNLRC